MKEVTVVIPNYNGEKFLTNCLNSLRKQKGIDFDTIVVDNGSIDESLKLLRENYTETQIIEMGRNTGFCGAVNAGIIASDTPYVILLNNDVEVEEDFVAEMLKAIKRSRKIFSSSAMMCRYDERNIIDNAGNYYNALGWAFARGDGKNRDSYDTRRRVFSSCGGAAIYRKDIFEEIGYFDEEHFAYLEDVDVCYRAKINGYVNTYQPKAIVYHIGSGTSGSRHNSFKVRLSSKNSLYIIYKNMPLPQLILNLPTILAGLIIKQVYFIKKGFGKDYFLGLVEGLSSCRKSSQKVVYKRENLKNYISIQFELWAGLFRRLKN